MDLRLTLSGMVALISSGALIGFFLTKKEGFGKFTLKSLSIILILSLATIAVISETKFVSELLTLFATLLGFLFAKNVDLKNE